MDCPHCGATNPDSASFCSLCLTQFASPNPTRPSDFAAPGRSRDDVPADAADLQAAMVTALTSRPTNWVGEFLLRLDPSDAKWTPFLRYGPWVLLTVIGGVWWSLSGHAHRAATVRVPVPVQSSQVAQVREITTGPFGRLPAERVNTYATRVFIVPMQPEQAYAYYTKGVGAKELTKAGWNGPDDSGGILATELEVNYPLRSLPSSESGRPTILDARFFEWTRVVPSGPQSSEQQELVMTFGGPTDVNDCPKPAQAALTADKSVVRVTCRGASVKMLEFPQE